MDEARVVTRFSGKAFNGACSETIDFTQFFNKFIKGSILRLFDFWKLFFFNECFRSVALCVIISLAGKEGIELGFFGEVTLRRLVLFVCEDVEFTSLGVDCIIATVDVIQVSVDSYLSALPSL